MFDLNPDVKENNNEKENPDDEYVNQVFKAMGFYLLMLITFLSMLIVENLYFRYGAAIFSVAVGITGSCIFIKAKRRLDLMKIMYPNL